MLNIYVYDVINNHYIYRLNASYRFIIISDINIIFNHLLARNIVYYNRKYFIFNNIYILLYIVLLFITLLYFYCIK